jgi:hypothetical protein
MSMPMKMNTQEHLTKVKVSLSFFLGLSLFSVFFLLSLLFCCLLAHRRGCPMRTKARLVESNDAIHFLKHAFGRACLREIKKKYDAQILQ